MTDTYDWKSSKLIREVAERFEEHGKRIDSWLSVVQEKFQKDHTGMTASVGILMIGFSAISMWFGKSDILSSIFVGGGAMLLGYALYLRSKSSSKQLEYARKALELERERAQFAQKSAILVHIWEYGMPKNTPFGLIQSLIGETKNVPDNNLQIPQLLEKEEKNVESDGNDIGEIEEAANSTPKIKKRKANKRVRKSG